MASTLPTSYWKAPCAHRAASQGYQGQPVSAEEAADQGQKAEAGLEEAAAKGTCSAEFVGAQDGAPPPHPGCRSHGDHRLPFHTCATKLSSVCPSVRPSVCLSVSVFLHIKWLVQDSICCWNLAVVLVSCMRVSFLSPAQCMVHTSLDNSAMHKYPAALWSSNLTVLCTGDRWDAACVLETQLKLLSY